MDITTLAAWGEFLFEAFRDDFARLPLVAARSRKAATPQPVTNVANSQLLPVTPHTESWHIYLTQLPAGGT